MKKPSYTLSIPQPCDERWDAMNPSEKGRFCGSCQKQVVDFSGFSDREVIQMIEQASGKVCGRLHPQQLNRPMVLKPWAQRASVRFSGFFAGLMLLSTADRALSQNVKTEADTISNEIGRFMEAERTESTASTRTINGQIVDVETGDSMAFASITIKGTTLGAASNEQGFYSLRIPDDLLNDTFTVRVTSLGYEPIEVHITQKELQFGVQRNFEMRMIEEIFYGVVEIERKPRHRSRNH